jgi:hypothetical protein
MSTVKQHINNNINSNNELQQKNQTPEAIIIEAKCISLHADT